MNISVMKTEQRAVSLQQLLSLQSVTMTTRCNGVLPIRRIPFCRISIRVRVRVKFGELKFCEIEFGEMERNPL